jgi:pimeloyl-ACP methyl ester carboxylesterase
MTGQSITPALGHLASKLRVSLLAALLLAGTAADAAYIVPVLPPQGPAAIQFAQDFPATYDHQWGFRVGGFGGILKGLRPNHVPVIFVHGNNDDHTDWYTVKAMFEAAGFSDQALYALSYNGLGGNSLTITTSNPQQTSEHQQEGQDGRQTVTSNEPNVADLYDFIMAVRAYTGVKKFTIVGHSLGVTLARRTLKVHPELRQDLVAFVGIAGANHGTALCPPGSQGVIDSCDEIAAGTAWLAALNGPGGNDETYGPAQWMTVYDGTGIGDPTYAATYAQSPQLLGADNRQFPFTYHNDLREVPAIVQVYMQFILDAEAGVSY